MYYNNNLYVFVNGISTLLNQQSVNYPLSNLISLNSISLGVDIGPYFYSGNTNYSTNKFYGIISQPLITKIAKYNINGFLPDWILTPKQFNNVIFWIENSIDIITSQTVPLTGNVIINTLESSPIIPIITLNSGNLDYILLNSNYTDTGVIVSYLLQPNIIPYIISIKDELFNEYLITPLNALNNNILNMLDTSILNKVYTITYRVIDKYNKNIDINKTLVITKGITLIELINKPAGTYPIVCTDNTIKNYYWDGEYLIIYREGLNANLYTSNWNTPTTKYMDNFGGLGSGYAHGYVPNFT